MAKKKATRKKAAPKAPAINVASAKGGWLVTAGAKRYRLNDGPGMVMLGDKAYTRKELAAAPQALAALIKRGSRCLPLEKNLKK